MIGTEVPLGGTKTDNFENVMSVWFFGCWQMLPCTRSSVPL